MPWHDKDSWATAAFAPKASTILVTLICAILLPIFLHAFLYRTAVASKSAPGFLVLGPSGAGKTALVVETERRSTSSSPTPQKSKPQTHTSTTPHTITALLPSPHIPASASYRSPGDPDFERARAFTLTDTPGHPKLRHFTTNTLSALDTSASNIQGLIFVVDAADESSLEDAAAYLHDVLLALQRRHTRATTSKTPRSIRVLVAANKGDLFTALPASLVKARLESGVSTVRRSRAKALRDGDGEEETEAEWLGEGGEGEFEFAQLEEVGVEVEVLGGSVVGAGTEGVEGWVGWVAGGL